MREQEALLLMKMGEAAESLQALPVFREEATNNLSPRRQMEAKIMSLRILSSNAKWPEARTASDELRQFLDGEPASRLPQGDRVSAYQAIAEFEIRAGDGPAAESTLNSLDARADVSGAGPAYHARTLMLRGLAMRQNGEHQNAIRWLQAAEIAYSDSFGPVNPQTLLCRLNQIPSLLAMGNRTQAVALVDEARATLQKHLPANAAVMRQISKMSSDLSDVDYEEAKSKAFNALFFN